MATLPPRLNYMYSLNATGNSPFLPNAWFASQGLQWIRSEFKFALPDHVIHQK